MSGRSHRFRYRQERPAPAAWPPVLVFWMLVAGGVLYLLGEHRIHALGWLAYLPLVVAVVAPLWLHRVPSASALRRPDTTAAPDCSRSCTHREDSK